MSRTGIVILGIAAALLAFPFAARYIRSANSVSPPGQNTAAAAVPVAVPAPSPVPLSSAPSGTPAIVTTDPPIGAMNVPSGLKEIRVTFDTPMAAGFSWTGGGPSFPGASVRPTGERAGHSVCAGGASVGAHHGF